jgi:hypothetical protein
MFSQNGPQECGGYSMNAMIPKAGSCCSPSESGAQKSVAIIQLWMVIGTL